MTNLEKYLNHFVSSGFTVLPLDQAKEAYTNSHYLLAYKPLRKLDSWTSGVLIITGGLNQFSVIFPKTFGTDPSVKLGFCGQTLLINNHAYTFNNLKEIDESARLSK